MDITNRLEKLELEELQEFTQFVDWFFSTYESVAFEKGGAHLPCPRWWEHPEAVERLYTLYCLDAAIEDKDGSGFDNFWRGVDHHCGYLFGVASPFRKCTYRVHRSTVALISHLDGVLLGQAAFEALNQGVGEEFEQELGVEPEDKSHYLLADEDLEDMPDEAANTQYENYS